MKREEIAAGVYAVLGPLALVMLGIQKGGGPLRLGKLEEADILSALKGAVDTSYEMADVFIAEAKK